MNLAEKKLKIASLKKNISNPMFPEALKPKFKMQVETLQKEIDAEEKPSTKNQPIFKIGEKVLFKESPAFSKAILSYKLNRDKEYVYEVKNLSNGEKASYKENELEPYEIEFIDLKQNKTKFKVGDIVANVDKKTVGIVRDVYEDGELKTNEDGNVYISDLEYYDKTKHFDYKISPTTKNEIEQKKSNYKKPKAARTVKQELKKYHLHRDIKSVTVLEDGKKVTYKGTDVLNGAQFLAKGGTIDEIATYYPIRDIVEVTLENGSKVKPANGYHIKTEAKPIAEFGAELPIEIYNIPRLARGGELKVGDKVKYDGATEHAKVIGVNEWNTMEDEVIVEFPDGKQITEGSLSFHKVTPIAAKLGHGRNENISQQDFLEKTNRYFEKGGETEDFNYIKFLDFVQPNVADSLNEFDIKLAPDYYITRKNKEYEPVIIYKGIDGVTNELSIGYFDDNDPDLKLLLSIDFNLLEKDFTIHSKPWSIDDVDKYAKGGWTKDHKYLNKSENYEVRYAKDKNRSSYLEKGGTLIGRKAKGVSVSEIAKMHNVTEKYLKKQLERGQKVELEHTTDDAIAYAIAKDHIYENPDYYILLEKIEMKAKGGEVKTSKFKLNDILVPEKDGDYSEDFWKVTELDFSKNSMTISKLKNGKFTEDLISSPTNAERGFRRANNEELEVLEKWQDKSEYAKGGELKYKKPSYNTKITGNYTFVTKDKTYDLKIRGFEREGDLTDSLYFGDEQDNLKSEIGSIIIQNNLIAKLSKGQTVIAETSKGNLKGKLTRISDLYKEGGKITSKKGMVNNPKGSAVFAKAKEIRKPGQKWTDAVKEASLLLKK